MKIIADSISVSYNKKGNTVKVLDKVDISFENGKLTLITGRSGSGKTTLINVLSGILAPNDGQVYYDDTSVYMQSDEQLSAFRCENIGYIPQGASALSSLTVLQNVLLPSVLSGIRTSSSHTRLASERNSTSGWFLRMAAAAFSQDARRLLYALEASSCFTQESTRTRR